MRSASATFSVSSPRNSVGSETKSPYLALSCLAKSSALTAREAPSTNIQVPEKHQHPNPKRLPKLMELWAWNFSGAWSLEFGVSFGQRRAGFLQSGQQRLTLNLVLKFEQRVEQRLGPRRASRHVNVHRDDVVRALQHRVAPIHAAGRGTRAHRDDPFRLGHLVVDALHGHGHLVSHRARDDHAIGLPWRKAHHFHSEARNIKPARPRRHEFDGATSQSHRHRPDGILAKPVNGGVHTRVDYIAFNARIVAKFLG